MILEDYDSRHREVFKKNIVRQVQQAKNITERVLTMIDMIYNLRVGDIHPAEFSDEFNKLCIPFEDSLSEEQIDVFHKILDCVSETAATEIRAAYKVGFKDGLALMREVQE